MFEEYIRIYEGIIFIYYLKYKIIAFLKRKICILEEYTCTWYITSNHCFFLKMKRNKRNRVCSTTQTNIVDTHLARRIILYNNI